MVLKDIAIEFVSKLKTRIDVFLINMLSRAKIKLKKLMNFIKTG